MFCFGKKKRRYRHKVETQHVVVRQCESEESLSSPRYHNPHKHRQNNFYCNGKYYRDGRCPMPSREELRRYYSRTTNYQQRPEPAMLVYNYREGDQNPPRLRGGERYSTEDDGYLQQHDGIKEEYYDDRDRRIPGDGVMVKYSELGEYSDFLPRHDDEDPYYAAAGVAAAPPQYAYAQPAVVARPAVVAEAPASWAYVSASRTPKVLPSCYYSRDYDSRRYAPERDVYAARRIKPADARPEDPFWCRERDGHWHMRTYYSINRECYPGRWKMDPERGFLVFHRD